jgi:hypothetical protein
MLSKLTFKVNLQSYWATIASKDSSGNWIVKNLSGNGHATTRCLRDLKVGSLLETHRNVAITLL